jgi:hypothetical protein
MADSQGAAPLRVRGSIHVWASGFLTTITAGSARPRAIAKPSSRHICNIGSFSRSTIARRSPFTFYSRRISWLVVPTRFSARMYSTRLNRTKDRIDKILPFKYLDQRRGRYGYASCAVVVKNCDDKRESGSYSDAQRLSWRVRRVVYFLVLSRDCAVGFDRHELVLITFDRSAQFHERCSTSAGALRRRNWRENAHLVQRNGNGTVACRRT